MAVNIRPYVIINGKSSRELLGLLITSLPPISKAKMRVSAQEIDGRSGDIVTELGFSAYDKEISVALHGDYNVDEIISFFAQSGKIIFSNEPDKYYLFAQYNGIDFERLLRYKTAEVAFHCQPFKYSVSEGEREFTFSDEATSGSFDIRNNGNYISKPIITITGSGTVTLAINGNELMTIDMSEVSPIIIDSADMNAYNSTGLLMNRKITGNIDNISLVSGKNVISYTGTVTKISIENQSRWL